MAGAGVARAVRAVVVAVGNSQCIRQGEPVLVRVLHAVERGGQRGREREDDGDERGDGADAAA